MPTQPRSSQVIGAELAELRRYLPELPPHNVSGVRTELLARIGRLEREQHAALERERAAARDRDQRTANEGGRQPSAAERAEADGAE